MKDTKQRILDVSLDLFSRGGFSAVSVRDIAAVVGVRESAMYRHFPSKQAVFDQLVADYLKRSDSFMAGIHATPSPDPAVMEHTAELYGRLSDEDFLRIGSSVYTEFLMQPEVLKFWRMISVERLRDEKLAGMWTKHLFEEPIAFQTGMFGALIKAGVLKPVDSEMLALEFFTPLLLLYLTALPYEPDSPEFLRMLELAKKHMLHFRQTYTAKKENQ
jgi:AcrR family transcriptional regulator